MAKSPVQKNGKKAKAVMKGKKDENKKKKGR
jgi:hypothetical protein